MPELLTINDGFLILNTYRCSCMGKSDVPGISLVIFTAIAIVEIDSLQTIFLVLGTR